MNQKYVKPERIWLKSRTDLSELWVQDLIANDPSILGLGDLELRGREKTQPRAGRLDLLLQDPDTKRRYEVEVQLGSTDEAHIIRTIEYWDIERKRYPQYDHCAVIVAEDITSRFLNVISLFNGTMPIIAIQMQAMKVGDNTTVVFTTVIDELVRGMVDEDEEVEAAPKDRNYWESKATKATLALADNMLKMLKSFDETLNLRYTKHYIGLEKNGQPYNFVAFVPKQNTLQLNLRLPRTDEIDAKITASNLDTLEYARWGAYRLRLTKDDIDNKFEALKDLSSMAFQRRING
jgi:predicted transport protein